MAVLKSIGEVKKRFPTGVPLLDPVKDMKIGDKEFKEVIKKIGTFENRLLNHALHKDENLATLLEQYKAKAAVQEELDKAKEVLRKSKSLRNTRFMFFNSSIC